MFEILFAISIIFLIVTLFFYRKLQIQLNILKSDKKSMLTRFGKATEQFIPFLTHYPYKKENFRFIGSPIDGIQFEDDKIIFVEFKTGDANLSEVQKRIKEIIENKNVEFKEFRI